MENCSLGTCLSWNRLNVIHYGYIGIMDKKMETTIVYWGYIGTNGKENGNY